MKFLFLFLFTCSHSLAFAQKATLTTNDRSANIFYQDSEYIYRSVPESINVTNRDLMYKLIEAGTLESLTQTKTLLNKVEIRDFDSALSEVEADIETYLNIDEQIELLNKQVANFADSNSHKNGTLKDYLPKSITVYAGLGGSFATLIAVSGALTPGYTIMLDRVDRIKKSELKKFGTLNDNSLSLENIQSVFSKINESSFDLALSRGVTRQITNRLGNTLTVETYLEIDAAPVVIVTPSIGVGAGGGGSVRIGVMVSWWKGNHVLEPEDHYGWGLAYSQDMVATAGYNFKAGYINSDTANGYLDMWFASFAFLVGPEIVASPAKVNLMIIKDPVWLLKKLGFGKQAEEWINGIEGSRKARWENLTGKRKPLSKDKPTN